LLGICQLYLKPLGSDSSDFKGETAVEYFLRRTDFGHQGEYPFLFLFGEFERPVRICHKKIAQEKTCKRNLQTGIRIVRTREGRVRDRRDGAKTRSFDPRNERTRHSAEEKTFGRAGRSEPSVQFNIVDCTRSIQTPFELEAGSRGLQHTSTG